MEAGHAGCISEVTYGAFLMSAPAPQVQYAGVGTVGADQYNTFVQVVINYAQLRTITGLQDMAILALGTVSEGDGGQALFYFNSLSTALDNNTTVIAPTGSVQGRWLRLGNPL
jgi:hypothetical protein